ncbi:hypothetical protein LshimejAT787_0706250 [Lyophyllum shimeji]|uniref:Uncharacterized protein n=1 Tax=Lyophyllum shimeji TaxID=47721 RepID=A0A9P3PQD6_LYOSH|nr:hypothetical protein LshimejAT787_0706250 [Lyophyllum shimeji]
MIISSSITVGQITFVLRVAVQILSYVGAAIIGVLILGTAPRVASIATHDTLNRIVGAASATKSTVKWLFNRVRRNHTDPTPPTDLILILFLSLSYTIFVSLSDIGFLGFYACDVPGPNSAALPASINSTSNADALVRLNMVNGTDLSKVKAYHCDSSSYVHFVDQVFEYNCTSWHNGTYADQQLFSGINSTDSETLMPRQLAHYSYDHEAVFDLNTFAVGPTTKRVVQPIVERGLAIQPHATGVRMVVGVPELQPNTRVDLSKAMAVEVDVGCMSLGVIAAQEVGAFDSSDFFRTNGSWRTYAGPDYLQSVLSKTVDDTRAYLQPYFDPLSIDDRGQLKSINGSNQVLYGAANVGGHRLPRASFDSSPDQYLLGNCTEALQKQLGIRTGGKDAGTMCSFLGIGGTRSLQGVILHGFERMVCASATQVNLVAATVQADASLNVTVNVTHLPSDLTYTIADYWDPQDVGNDTTKFNQFVPYERYTLNDNPNSPTTHYIRHSNLGISDDHRGQGTAGNAISAVGDVIVIPLDLPRYAGLTMLDEGFDYVNITPDILVKWVGQVGGSYWLGSVAYNGWAALHSAPIRVVSTGGRLGACYKPYYALGFVPLVFSATVIMCWAFLLLFKGGIFGSRTVKNAYAGVGPYNGAVCPGAEPNQTLLAWESSPQPRLQLISKGYPLASGANDTALQYLKSPPSYP